MPSTTRRALLAALAGGSAALAGCSSSCPDSSSPSPEARVATGGAPAPFDGPPATDWPAPRFDAANTGFPPGAAAPSAPLAVRWRTELPGGGVPDVAAASAPVVAGDRVVLATPDGVVALRFRDGARAWRTTAVAPATTDAAPGFGAEPVAPVVGADGTVYVAAGDALVALDPADGSERWRYADARAVGPPRVADGAVYAATAEGLVAVDAADGTERWTHAAAVDRRPVAASAGAVVATAGTAVVAVGAADGHERWRAEVHGGRFPVAAGATVYVGGDEGLQALDLATGERRWTFDRGSGRAISPPVVTGDTLYVVEQPAEAGDATFALDRTGGAPDPQWCSYVAEGAVTAATSDTALGLLAGGAGPEEAGPPLRLVAFDERLGGSRWGLAVAEQLLPPAVVEGAVVVADRTGAVRALGGA